MTDITLVALEAQDAAVLRGTASLDDLPAFLERAFTATFLALEGQGLAPAGPPLARYPQRPQELIVVEAGFPTTEAIVPADEVVPIVLAGGPAVTTVHHGSSTDLGRTYVALQAWAETRGIVLGDEMWESYLSGPDDHPDPDEWRTRVTWPLAPM